MQSKFKVILILLCVNTLLIIRIHGAPVAVSELDKMLDKAELANKPSIILQYLNEHPYLSDDNRAISNIILGILFLKKQQYENSIKYYNRALLLIKKIESIAAHYGEREIWFGLYHAYYAQNKYKKAISYLENILKENDKYPEAKLHTDNIYLRMSIIYSDMKDYISEKKMLLKSLEKQNCSPEGNYQETSRKYSYLSHCNYNLKEYDQSIASGMKALANLNKDKPGYIFFSGMVYIIMGKAYYAKKNHAKAIESMRKAYYILLKAYGANHRATKATAEYLKDWQPQKKI